jgi:hypothetical protein
MENVMKRPVLKNTHLCKRHVIKSVEHFKFIAEIFSEVLKLIKLVILKVQPWNFS